MATNLTLLEPWANCVYQRDESNIATIPISGGGAKGLANVLATFTVVKVGDVQTLEYAEPIVQTIAVDKDGNFGGVALLPAGSYSLTVKAGDATISVSRVYAGEVFILFGHSFIQGGHDQSHQQWAQDERVITLLDGLVSRDFQFGKLTDKVGPFHGSPDAWGQLGDLLVQRLNVPVMFYGCGYGGSNILQSYELIKNISPRTSLPPGAVEPTRQPLEPIEDVLNNYVNKTGVRAILCEHGYNDRDRDTATFVAQFKVVIDYFRTRWNMPDLALVLVQEQLTQVPGTLAAMSTAPGLATLIKEYPATWKGPDFNESQWAGLFAQHDHLFGVAIDQYAKDWNASLTTRFFQDSVPYGPRSIPDVFPVVLYNAPTTDIKAIDWIILLLLGGCLVGVFVYKSKQLKIGFLLLALLALGRLTGKV